MGVVVVDAAAQVVASAREDGASALRLDIALGKAGAAVGMGVNSRALAAARQGHAGVLRRHRRHRAAQVHPADRRGADHRCRRRRDRRGRCLGWHRRRRRADRDRRHRGGGPGRTPEHAPGAAPAASTCMRMSCPSVLPGLPGPHARRRPGPAPPRPRMPRACATAMCWSAASTTAPSTRLCWSAPPPRGRPAGDGAGAAGGVADARAAVATGWSLADAQPLIRYLNETDGRDVAESGGRLLGLAAVPLQDVDAAITELRHAVETARPGGRGDRQQRQRHGHRRPALRAVFRRLRGAGRRRSSCTRSSPPAWTVWSARRRCSRCWPTRPTWAWPRPRSSPAGCCSGMPGLRIAFSHGGGTLASLLPRLQQGWLSVSGAGRADR